MKRFTRTMFLLAAVVLVMGAATTSAHGQTRRSTLLIRGERCTCAAHEPSAEARESRASTLRLRREYRQRLHAFQENVRRELREEQWLMVVQQQNQLDLEQQQDMSDQP